MKPTIEIYSEPQRNFYVDSLSVDMSEGMHDMATCFLSSDGTLRPGDIKGKPCRVSWGSSFAAMSLYGYVDTPADVDYDDGVGGFVVMVLGATSPMRSGQPRTWNRTTPFRIAKSIVEPYRLSLVVDKYVATIDQFMQTSDSDWQALLGLAGQTGMSLVARNNAVHLVDVRKALGRAAQRPVSNLTEPTSFVRMETPSPVGFDRYEFVGRDTRGAAFAVRGGPSDGVKRHSPQNFSSLEEARLAALRMQDRERHYVRAMAEFDSGVNVRPGDVVFCEGLRWFVSKVRHEVAFATNIQSAKMELHRSASARPSTSDVPRVPSPVLRSGRWVSSQKYEVEL